MGIVCLRHVIIFFTLSLQDEYFYGSESLGLIFVNGPGMHYMGGEVHAFHGLDMDFF